MPGNPKAQRTELETQQLDAQVAADPARTTAQSSAQTTTDSYALVSESEIDVTGRDAVLFVVEETGGVNAVDARLVGKVKSADDSESSYAPTGQSLSALAAGAADVLALDLRSAPYDTVAVQIKANVGASQGDVLVDGVARGLEH